MSETPRPIAAGSSIREGGRRLAALDAAQIGARARLLAPSRGQAFLRSAGPLAIGLGLAVFLQLVAKPHIGGYREKVMIDVGINIILAVSLNIVNGFTGQFSIGHAGFMAIGGYTAGYITYYGTYWLCGDMASHGGALSWPADLANYSGGFFGWGDAVFLSALLAGGLLAAAFGWIVGLPSLRLRGDYLAIVTLGFGEIVRVVIEGTRPVVSLDRIEKYTWFQLIGRIGGPMGFDGLPRYSTLFWVYAFVTITVLVAYRIKVSSFGRAFLAIRENEIAAGALGVPATRYKVRAFVVSSFFAGVAGGLFAHEIGNMLNPGELGFLKGFDIIIMVVLGGLGSISGAAVAAILLTILPEWLREPTHVWPLGVLVIVVLAIVRRGKKPWTLVWIAAATIAFELLRFVAQPHEINGVVHEIKLSEYRMIFYALSLILIMILRPQGLFGLGEFWDWRQPWRRWREGAKA